LIGFSVANSDLCFCGKHNLVDWLNGELGNQVQIT
jgi:hypothetical protein